jgi:hypothetical protein
MILSEAGLDDPSRGSLRGPGSFAERTTLFFSTQDDKNSLVSYIVAKILF